MENNKKKIYGLVGYPVKHSFSPSMHNAAFKSLGINAEYRLFELKKDEIKGFIGSLESQNISGFNVTVPYKQEVIQYLNGELASGVEAIGAVNTVRREEKGKLVGFNTDWAGFSKDLIENGFNCEDKAVSVLGAGGAARAVVYALREARAISIFDIDAARVQKLISDMKADDDFQADLSHCSSIEELPLEKCDLLINATPVGMQAGDPLLINPQRLQKQTLVYDCIYNPQETKLLKAAKDKGLKFSNGLGMLLYQGALAFQHWTHREPPVKAMREALMSNL